MMFSGALAGVLKFGAVAITAAGLGTSVYFIAQVGDAGDGTSRLQAPSTMQRTPDEAPDQLSPPNDITPPPPDTTPAAPTPTFPPAPTPPGEVDTSDWKTYTSPLGFSVRFPPDWRAQARGRLSLMNPLFAQRLDDMLAAGEGPLLQVAGMADLTVGIDIWNRFDPNSTVEQCRSPSIHNAGPPGRAQLVTFLGRTAVLCERITQQRPGVETAWLGLSVEFPPGHTSLIGWSATPPTSDDLTTLAAILSSFRFQGPAGTPVPFTPTGPWPLTPTTGMLLVQLS